MIPTTGPWVPFLVGAVAFLYSMVGHGGASGQLAVLSMTTLSPGQVASSALVLNLVVAGIALVSFARAGHLDWRLTWPFLVGSVPAAAAGAAIHLSQKGYFGLVGAVLVYAALQMLAGKRGARAAGDSKPPAMVTAGATGAAIGVLSGVVGVGGGIFLSPLMILLRWAEPKHTAATSAAFIVANSMAGLAGRAHTGIAVVPGFWLLIACGVGGALLGAHIGARTISPTGLRRMLGVVLLMAAAKLLMGALR